MKFTVVAEPKPFYRDVEADDEKEAIEKAQDLWYETWLHKPYTLFEWKIER
jgi:hypothetical protein